MPPGAVATASYLVQQLRDHAQDPKAKAEATALFDVTPSSYAPLPAQRTAIRALAQSFHGSMAA